MKENDKSNSFLFNLYLKYKKNAQDNSEKKPESPQEFFSSVSASANGGTTDSPESNEAPEPVEKPYLSSLFEIYKTLPHRQAENDPVHDLLSLEEWILAPIKDLPFYSKCEKAVEELMRDASYKAKKILADAEKTRIEVLKTETMKNEENDKSVQPGASTVSAFEEPSETPSVDPASETTPEEPAAPSPVDASLVVKITSDKMYAFLLAIPPMFKGQDMTDESIAAALSDSKITFGIGDKTIKSIAADHAYLQVYLVAEGVPSEDGIDGTIVDKINYDSELEIQQDQFGQADFKNLNMIRSISKDQLICEIIPPTDGTSGFDVTGRELLPKKGKPAPAPNGKNTVISEDGTQLTATTYGEITFKNNRYFVEPVLTIRSNINYSIGNVDFNGDVIIYGDVCSGFSVNAGGSITIHGMVESATVTAGGDVTIEKGMNGNFTGILDAGGTVRTSFLENCTVYTGGSLYSNSIISCNVFCEDSVYVQGNQGVIIGGNIRALKIVEARTIGSKSRRETIFMLGEMPRLLEKKKVLQTELTSIKDMLVKMEKNINFLEGNIASLPPGKQEILSQLIEQRTLYQERQQEVTETLVELNSAKSDYKECRVQSNMIFPPTKVIIGSNFYTVTDISSKCNLYLGDDGIQMGTL